MKDSRSLLYAGFWRRAAAFALDYVIILLYLAAISLVMFVLNTWTGLSEMLFSNRVRAQVAGFLLITLPVTLYFALGESSSRRATWGKVRVGLQVTDRHGEQIGRWRSVARTGLKFVPWELSHTLIWQIALAPNTSPNWINSGFVLVYGLLGLSLACLVFTRKHQAIHDLLAGTYVAKAS